MTAEGVAALLGIVVIAGLVFGIWTSAAGALWSIRHPYKRMFKNPGKNNHVPRTMDESLADHGDFRAYQKRKQ